MCNRVKPLERSYLVHCRSNNKIDEKLTVYHDFLTYINNLKLRINFEAFEIVVICFLFEAF